MQTVSDAALLAMPAPARPALRLVVLDREEALRQAAPAWDDLLRRSSANEPMLSPPWLLNWWEVYGRPAGRQLRVGLFLAGDRLVGLAPLQRRRFWYRPGVPFRRLEWLGADGDDPNGVCAEYLNLIVEPGWEEAVVDGFLDGLAQSRFGRWDEVVLAALDGQHPLVPRLEAGCRKHWATELSVQTHAPFVTLPATWEVYLRTLRQGRRYVLSSQREVEKWAQGTLQFRRAATWAEVEQGWDTLRRLHGSRWQAAGQGGVFHAAAFTNFHEKVLRQFHDLGAVELLWLEAHGAPVAVNYSFRWNGKVYFYQCGRLMDLPSRVRVGIVLHAEAIRQAIADGLREYDFLGGDASYKQMLAPGRRPLVQLRAVRGVVRDRCRRLGERCVDLLRGTRARVAAWRARNAPPAAAPGGPEESPDGPEGAP